MLRQARTPPHPPAPRWRAALRRYVGTFHARTFSCAHLFMHALFHALVFHALAFNALCFHALLFHGLCFRALSFMPSFSCCAYAAITLFHTSFHSHSHPPPSSPLPPSSSPSFPSPSSSSCLYIVLHSACMRDDAAITQTLSFQLSIFFSFFSFSLSLSVRRFSPCIHMLAADCWLSRVVGCGG